MPEPFRLDVVYCEGWAGELVGPIAAGTARERDERGEPYAVALLLPDTGLPLAVLEIAWQDRFARCWQFDARGRRRSEVEYRRLADDRLFILRRMRWQYQTPAQPEFAGDAPSEAWVFRADGAGRHEVRKAGGLRVSRVDVALDELLLPVPGFADMASLAALEVPVELRERSDPEPGGQPGERPWRPSRPRRPVGLAELFTPGARISDQITVTEVRDAGTLRLRSGRLLAADPLWLTFNQAPFTEPVAPGEYPVQLSMVGFPDAELNRVAAAKLAITTEPVASWELALRPGEDPILLPDRAFYGFGVDAGMGCFVDADAAGALEEIAHATEFAVAPGQSDELVDPDSGMNLIAYSSGYGDGYYPTWIGRTAAGDLACFVADMCLVPDD